MTAISAVTKAYMLLGHCVPCVKQNASKFKILRLELDPNLLMVVNIIYFSIKPT